MDANKIQFTKIELILAKHLFKHYKERWNSRQLAKSLEINHAHAGKLCNSLADKLILKKEEIGNAVYFSFDYENKTAVKFIDYLLTLEEKISPKWLSSVMHKLSEFKSIIIMGIVFGSSIKNSRFNDIDVLLVYNKKEIKKINQIKEYIRKSQIVKEPIRYVDIEEEDIFKNKNDKIFYNILSENIIFHNPEKYIEVIMKCRK